jgi:hypothetical protein
MQRFIAISIFLLMLSISAFGQRPKVGVVLCGGGAKGAAHVGVLKVLEEYGIPIDYIAGTSMGAIVGGLYAIGYSADELDSLVMVQDWDFVMSDKVPRKQVSFEAKKYDDRFLLKIPFSFRRDRGNQADKRQSLLSVPPAPELIFKSAPRLSPSSLSILRSSSASIALCNEFAAASISSEASSPNSRSISRSSTCDSILLKLSTQKRRSETSFRNSSAAFGSSQKSGAVVFNWFVESSSRFAAMSKRPPQRHYTLFIFFNLFCCYHISSLFHHKCSHGP